MGKRRGHSTPIPAFEQNKRTWDGQLQGGLKGLLPPAKAPIAPNHPVLALCLGLRDCSLVRGGNLAPPGPGFAVPPWRGSGFRDAASSPGRLEQRVRELVNKHAGESAVCSEKPLGVCSLETRWCCRVNVSP